MTGTRAVLALAIAATFGGSDAALALDLSNEASPRLKTEAAIPRSPLFSEGTVEVAYSANSDFNVAREPRTFANALEATWSANLLKKVSVYVGADVRGTAVGNEVVLDNDNPTIGDLTVGAFKPLTLDERNTLIALGGVDLPTSGPSRREGYTAIAQIGGRTMTRIYKNWVRLDNSVSAMYVGNRFVVSPTTLETNPDFSGSYSLAIYLRLFGRVRIGASAGAKATHYLDGSTLAAFNNAQTIRYDSGDWTARLSLVHGDWIDRQAMDFWYVDRFRQSVTLRVSYAF